MPSRITVATVVVIIGRGIGELCVLGRVRIGGNRGSIVHIEDAEAYAGVG